LNTGQRGLKSQVKLRMIEYKNKWLGSYETLKFDTADGDLDFGQYAVVEGGNLVRTRPKDEAQFDFVEELDTEGLEEVNIIEGEHCYYDEFLTAKGAEAVWAEIPKEIPASGIIRIQSTAKKYWDTARIKNHPQPERIEQVSKLPPPEPPQPHNEPHSIAFDATSNSGLKSSVSSYSWSHTTGSGSDRLLVVGHSHYYGQDRTVSSITYNGNPLTEARTDLNNSAYKIRSALYYLVAPDTGSKTVAVTLSDSIAKCAGGAITYTGAAQTGQPDADNGATGDSSSPSVAVTTTEDNCWVVSVLATIQSITGCANTQRWNISTMFSYGFGGSDEGPVSPAGEQSMSWSLFGNMAWAISATSFAPVAEGGLSIPVAMNHFKNQKGA